MLPGRFGTTIVFSFRRARRPAENAKPRPQSARSEAVGGDIAEVLILEVDRASSPAQDNPASDQNLCRFFNGMSPAGDTLNKQGESAHRLVEIFEEPESGRRRLQGRRGCTPFGLAGIAASPAYHDL